MSNPTVSVIVPFYNIEDYVYPCLSSLLAQSFDGYEIICIDDGSEDHTFLRLTEIALTDSRIRVFTKPNGGLSDARNYGVQCADGKYVTFVDGDDIVSPFYLESLIKAQQAYSSDYVSGGFIALSQNEIENANRKWEPPESYSVAEKDKAIERFLYDNPLISACAHLAPIELYRNEPFPQGALYEDSLAFVKHVMPFTTFGFVDAPIYGYGRRSNSIVHVKMTDLSQVEEQISAIDFLQESILEKYPNLIDGCRYHRLLELSRIYRKIDNKAKSAELKQLKKSIYDTIRKDFSFVVKDESVSKIQKIRFVILLFFPMAYDACFSCYEKMHKDISA